MYVGIVCKVLLSLTTKNSQNRRMLLDNCSACTENTFLQTLVTILWVFHGLRTCFLPCSLFPVMSISEQHNLVHMVLIAQFASLSLRKWQICDSKKWFYVESHLPKIAAICFWPEKEAKIHLLRVKKARRVSTSLPLSSFYPYQVWVWIATLFSRPKKLLLQTGASTFVNTEIHAVQSDQVDSWQPAADNYKASISNGWTTFSLSNI